MPPTVTRRLPLAVLLAALLLPGAARAWWDDGWTGRKPLRIDTSATGASISEPIGTSPVLVRLHVGNFRFEAASESGADLRFVAGDDKTPLAHHLEKFDPLLGEALVWVEVPDLAPGARTDIWLYYGNPKAVPAEDAKGTYDQATALVYHFGEPGQPPRDSTSWGLQGASTGAGADGAAIGRGLRLDGATAVTIPGAPQLAWAAGATMTWSAWVKPAEEGASGILFARRGAAGSFAIGFEAGKPFVELDRGSGPQRASAETALPGGWHHLAVTAGEGLILYVDGKLAAMLAGALPALDGAATLGGAGPSAVPVGGAGEAAAPLGRPAAAKGAPAPAPSAWSLPGLRCDLDELQLSSVARPAGFLRAAAVSQGADPGKFLAMGQDEESGGAHGGYLTILLGAVTLDGWIVIGLLGVMAVVSWWVMGTKAGYLNALERANAVFEERFQHASANLADLVESAAELGEGKVAMDSSLFRIFQVAAEEVRKRTRARKALTAEALESIRASLDACLVRENQRLSRSMVLLTIAISGGPFLGLLGTVIGVMITFAAIAAAGDVNVNAIAPGIAAALVATVAGLAVAIPALFGYNWLLTRAKETTATMQVFVDELVTKMAESYMERARRDERAERTMVVVSE